MMPNVLLRDLTMAGALLLTLVGCRHRHPEAQVFRGEGRTGYLGLPSKGLEYRGRIELRGRAHDSLAVEVDARNRTADSVVVQMSSMCSPTIEPGFSVRVYKAPRGLLQPRGRAVWTLDAWRQAKARQAEAKRAPRPIVNGIEYVSDGSCPSLLYALRFGSGDSQSLGVRSIAIVDVLGDSLPPGRYSVSAVIRRNFGFGDIRETTVGEVDLRVSGR